MGKIKEKTTNKEDYIVLLQPRNIRKTKAMQHTNYSQLKPKTFALIGVCSVGFLAIATGAGYLASMPRTASEGYSERPRALTHSEMADRCTERFYGEMGRQCMREIYRDNEALPKEYQAKTRWGVDK